MIAEPQSKHAFEIHNNTWLYLAGGAVVRAVSWAPSGQSIVCEITPGTTATVLLRDVLKHSRTSAAAYLVALKNG